MLNSHRTKEILGLAFPIMGGMLSQTLMNVADAVMVGHLPQADQALNAQGIASQSVWALAAFLIGIGSAVQTWASRRMGEQKGSQSGHGLSIALYYSLLVGVPLSLVGVWNADVIMEAIIKTKAVSDTAIPYFQIRSGTWFLIMINFSFRGFFNGISKPRIYFTVIWVSQIINIILSLIFIYGFFGFDEMGVTGAALGTALATLFGTVMYFLMSLKFRKEYEVFHLPRSYQRQKEILRVLMRLSVPAGLTGIFTSAGFLIFMIITDKIGVTQSAASNILVQLASVSFLPAIGFGIAAATLVSKNIGASKYDEAYAWGMDTAKLGSAILGMVGIVFFLAPDLVLQGFTHDQNIIEKARLIVQLLGFGMFFDTTGNILSQALIGAGAVRAVLMANIIGMWLIFLPGAYYFGLLKDGGMIGLWIPLFVYRIGLAVVVLYIYRKRKWLHIKA